jgi:hypothetical protein
LAHVNVKGAMAVSPLPTPTAAFCLTGMSTLAIVDDLGLNVCLEQVREAGEYQDKEGAK